MKISNVKKSLAVVAVLVGLVGPVKAIDLEDDMQVSARAQSVVVPAVAVERVAAKQASNPVIEAAKTVYEIVKVPLEAKASIEETIDGFKKGKLSYQEECKKHVESGKPLKWYNKVWFAVKSYAPPVVELGKKLYTFGKKVAEFAAAVMIIV